MRSNVKHFRISASNIGRGMCSEPVEVTRLRGDPGRVPEWYETGPLAGLMEGRTTFRDVGYESPMHDRFEKVVR
jgi:hypothetical protein